MEEVGEGVSCITSISAISAMTSNEDLVASFKFTLCAPECRPSVAPMIRVSLCSVYHNPITGYFGA